MPPFFHKLLTAGTLIAVKSDTANIKTRHAVPAVLGMNAESGSIVIRQIQEVVPWPKMIQLAEKCLINKRKEYKAKNPEQKARFAKRAAKGLQRAKERAANAAGQTSNEGKKKTMTSNKKSKKKSKNTAASLTSSP